MSTQAIKTMNQIVLARSRMVGAQTGATTEQALAATPNTGAAYCVVRPGLPARYVASNGGWTSDPTQALTWNNTTDLLRAAYKLNISGLRIIAAPTPADLAVLAGDVATAAASRKASLAARNAKKTARKDALRAARKPTAITSTETQARPT